MKISKKTTFLVGVQLLPAMTPIVASADTISDVITKAHNAGLRVDVNDSTKRVQSKAEADRLNAEQRAKSEADAHALSAKIDKYLQDKRDAEEYNRTVVSEHDRAIEADQARIQDIRNGNLKIASDNAAAQEDYLRRLKKFANKMQNAFVNTALKLIEFDRNKITKSVNTKKNCHVSELKTINVSVIILQHLSE